MLRRELLDLPHLGSNGNARALLDGVARPAPPPGIDMRLPTAPEPPQTLAALLTSAAPTHPDLPAQTPEPASTPLVRVEVPRKVPAPPPRAHGPTTAS